MTVQEALDCLGNTSRAASALEEALVSLQEIHDAGATLVGELIGMRIEIVRLKEEIKALKGA